MNLEYNFIMKLSVVMPVFNEENTLKEIVEKVLSMEVVYELLIVDDGSINGTREILKELVKRDKVRVILKEKNEGKGSAVTLGIKNAVGDMIIIQDADLEYDPRDYQFLIEPIENGEVDVVYGSRFLKKPKPALYFSSRMANMILTFITNILFSCKLTDMETCYKLFKSEIIKSVNLKEKRFGFEPEVTAKVARIPKIRIYEVGISYYGRTFEEGKKINWKDGFRAIYCVIKYNL